MADARIANKAAALKKLASIPQAVQEVAAPALASSAAQLVDAMRRAAPVLQSDHQGRVAGALRASIQAIPGDNKLSVKIVAGGKSTTVKVRKRVKTTDFAKAVLKSLRLGEGDAANKGEFDYVRAVEFGHHTHKGVNIPPHPFFYPTYRAFKKSLRTKQFAEVRKALKKLFPA